LRGLKGFLEFFDAFVDVFGAKISGAPLDETPTLARGIRE